MSRAEIQSLDCTNMIAQEGWDCPDCGHRHSGKTLANICIGCPCGRTERPQAADAVDPSAADPGTPTPRDASSSSSPLALTTPEPPVVSTERETPPATICEDCHRLEETIERLELAAVEREEAIGHYMGEIRRLRADPRAQPSTEKEQ